MKPSIKSKHEVKVEIPTPPQVILDATLGRLRVTAFTEGKSPALAIKAIEDFGRAITNSVKDLKKEV